MRAFPRAAVRAGMRRYVAWVNGLTAPALVARDLLVESPLVHPSAAIRREALERLGGWRDGPFPEDYDLWLRAAEAGGLLSNLARPLLLWREGPARATRRDPRYALPAHRALKCRHLRRTVLRGRDEVALWGAGATGKATADALLAEGVRAALFLEVDRKKIGGTCRGAPVRASGEAAALRGRLPLLVAVGAPGARDLIRAELARQGLQSSCATSGAWPDGCRATVTPDRLPLLALSPSGGEGNHPGCLPLLAGRDGVKSSTSPR